MKHIVLGSALALFTVPVLAGQFDELYQIEQQTKRHPLSLNVLARYGCLVT